MIRSIGIYLAVIGITAAAHAAAPEQRPAEDRVKTPSTVLVHSMLAADEPECRLEATAAPSRSQESRLTDLVRQHRAVSRLSLSQDSLIDPDEPLGTKGRAVQGHCS